MDRERGSGEPIGLATEHRIEARGATCDQWDVRGHALGSEVFLQPDRFHTAFEIRPTLGEASPLDEATAAGDAGGIANAEFQLRRDAADVEPSACNCRDDKDC